MFGILDETDAFEQDCLDAHNIYRTKHGVPPLLWSHQLKEDAQKWANRLADMGDELQHDDMKPLNEGENLAHFSPPSEKCYGAKGPGCVQCREIVKDWYDEEADYDFTQGHRKPGAVVLHFTQVRQKQIMQPLLLGPEVENNILTFRCTINFPKSGLTFVHLGCVERNEIRWGGHSKE